MSKLHFEAVERAGLCHLNGTCTQVWQRRVDLGLLQREVAQELRVNEMTICNWETNRTSPQLRFIRGIVAFLGYSPYYTQSDSLGKRILAHPQLRHGSAAQTTLPAR